MSIQELRRLSAYHANLGRELLRRAEVLENGEMSPEATLREQDLREKGMVHVAWADNLQEVANELTAAVGALEEAANRISGLERAQVNDRREIRRLEALLSGKPEGGRN